MLADTLNIIAAYPVLAYVAIFLAMFIEGDIVIFTTFFLIHEGTLGAGWALTTIILGVFCSDVAWYFTGRIKHPQFLLFRWLHVISARTTWRFDKHLQNRTF